ncbi:guanine nucleotide-binding protein g(o) subunit alpha [Anaeramoeba flamelloides]|uniref:Guanine nucleotide-binding protein g(O) subunit alpha n=2 Tax=Anaeramoeba flamelloides TaxID=1746091 RepID=A0AAV7ZVS1_9EUKA|nr:guanine nucleotide-binding protein g(o) subunit alpha [Anaeramoeba flamelloides]
MGKKLSKKQESSETVHSQKIDELMKTDNKEVQKEIKILVLGTGDSGKSTFIKQLQILYKGGFCEQDRFLYRTTIRVNLMYNMKTLIQIVEELKINIQKRTQKIVKRFDRSKKYCEENLTEKMKNAIINLWSDPGFKEAYERRNLFELPDSANYYFDSCERIFKEDYQPNDKDVLFCRIPTTGVNEIELQVNNKFWKVVDVGGQRSERRKWIHQFENVTIIVYITSVSEFDQQLSEDRSINRMHESLLLFDTISTGDFFKKKNFFILFNKIDLLKKKIQNVDLSVCFPKYKGGKDLNLAIKFIRDKFIEIGENSKRNLFFQQTCAIETEKIKNIFDSVTTTVLEDELKGSGYL